MQLINLGEEGKVAGAGGGGREVGECWAVHLRVLKQNLSFGKSA